MSNKAINKFPAPSYPTNQQQFEVHRKTSSLPTYRTATPIFRKGNDNRTNSPLPASAARSFDG
jgi:hypothetical protein